MREIYGQKPEGNSPACLSTLHSVEGFLNGAVGVTREKIGTEENFWALVRDVYDLPRPEGSFWRAIEVLRGQLVAMPRKERKRRQREARDRLGTKPNKGKPRIAKEPRQPSPAKLKAREAYRAKHLVMVTKDGKSLFDNVKQHAEKPERDAFYASWDWRKLRMQVIKRHARRCMCCGSTPEDTTVDGKPVRLVVDHIKPVANYWHLRLVASNLQILCDECNMGKGAWDETDHRSDSERQIAQQLNYSV